MQLSIKNEQLQIDMNLWERIWAFFFNQTLQIPLNHICRVTIEKPDINWKEVRLPGTSIPGVIKAGTYYTEAGREFWYVTRDDRFLTLELTDEFYKKIVLTLDDNQAWANQIEQQRSLLISQSS